MDKKVKKSLINYIMDVVGSNEHWGVQFMFNHDELIVADRHSPLHDHFKYDDEELMFKVSQFVEMMKTGEWVDEDQEQEQV